MKLLKETWRIFWKDFKGMEWWRQIAWVLFFPLLFPPLCLLHFFISNIRDRG